MCQPFDSRIVCVPANVTDYLCAFFVETLGIPLYHHHVDCLFVAAVEVEQAAHRICLVNYSDDVACETRRILKRVAPPWTSEVPVFFHHVGDFFERCHDSFHVLSEALFPDHLVVFQ